MQLDPDVPQDAALSLLKSYPAEAMTLYEVSLAVGNVRNKGPELIEPVS
jgi:putative SOS response-associated peptidase YedK